MDNSRHKVWAYVTSFSEEVTGSNTLFVIKWIDGREAKFIVDCGQFQEERGFDDDNVVNLNVQEFQYNVDELDFAIATHFHTDHIGRFPYLIKKGFSQRIYTTYETKLFANIIFEESRERLEESFTKKIQKWRKTVETKGYNQSKKYYTKSNQDACRPFILYGETECTETLNHMQVLELSKTITVKDGLDITFYPNGHVLGSVCVVIKAYYDNESLNILVTGDIGYENKITKVRTRIPKKVRNEIDCILSESTYGASIEKRNIKQERLKHVEILRDAMLNNKRLVYLVNAVERPEVVMTDIQTIINNNELGELTDKLKKTPIVFDSTMGKDALSICNSLLGENANYKQPICIDAKNRARWLEAKDRHILFLTSPMYYQGTFTMYAPFCLGDINTTIVFCSYVKEHVTNIISLPQGAKIMYAKIPVIKKCKMYRLNHYSSHMDISELTSFLSIFKNVNTIMFHHGSYVAKDNNARRFESENVSTYALQRGQTFRLNKQGVTKMYS